MARDWCGYRKVVVPTPPILPACNNCRFFRYSIAERRNAKGEVTQRKVKLRCTQLDIGVHNNCVCDSHVFAHADCRDC